MKGFRRTRQSVDVAASVATQVDTARRLVGITDQKLLSDPTTNPATRGRADQLRTEQQLAALDQKHKRALRRGRVADSRAAAAEKALEAITAAREATSPGRAVSDLTRTRTRYMVGCLVLSFLLSIGSAMAIEAWLQNGEGESPAGLGYVVEAGLTVLSTCMIVLRGRLAARGTELVPWMEWTLWSLIVLPLICSAVLATMGSPVGAICSIGAAAWSVAAYVATTSLSVAIGDALADVKEADEDALRRTAMGEDDTEDTTPAMSSADRWVTEQADTAAAQIQAWLATQDGGPDGGATPAQIDPRPTGPTPGRSTSPTQDETEGHTGGQIDDDQAEHQDDDEGRTGDVTPAIRARRAAGAQTRGRIESYLYHHPDAGPTEVADAVNVSPSTAKRHLRELRARGGQR